MAGEVEEIVVYPGAKTALIFLRPDAIYKVWHLTLLKPLVFFITFLFSCLVFFRNSNCFLFHVWCFWLSYIVFLNNSLPFAFFQGQRIYNARFRLSLQNIEDLEDRIRFVKTKFTVCFSSLNTTNMLLFWKDELLFQVTILSPIRRCWTSDFQFPTLQLRQVELLSYFNWCK
jgi:hypothetical protein